MRAAEMKLVGSNLIRRTSATVRGMGSREWCVERRHILIELSGQDKSAATFSGVGRRQSTRWVSENGIHDGRRAEDELSRERAIILQ